MFLFVFFVLFLQYYYCFSGQTLKKLQYQVGITNL